MDNIIEGLSIDLLKQIPIGDKLQKALSSIQKGQEAAMAYVHDESPEDLKKIRFGTVLMFGIVSKVATGKSIKDFDSADWNELAKKVVDEAILVDNSYYSVLVFNTYADYVDVSVKVLEFHEMSEEKRQAISDIAFLVRELGDQLKYGNISEVDYTEKCLWLLLEAMIKLLSAYSKIIIGEDASEFVEAVSMFAFEYGRYTLYKREQEILQMYLEHQYEVDEELQAKFDEYQRLLKERQEEFDGIIKDAFDPNIGQRLQSSVLIARNAGVDESEILDSVDKIDDFFS